jgi:hypothetical protein
MKKVILILICLLLLVVGCGKKDKKLTCTDSYSSNGENRISKYIYTFDSEGKKARTLHIKINSEFSLEVTNNEIEELYQSFSSLCSDEYNSNGESCEIKRDGNKIIETYDIDFEQLEEKDKYQYDNLDKNYEFIKDWYIDAEYICE